MPEVFTYGSLMYPEVVQTILGRSIAATELRDATLEGYRRVAIPDRPYPTGVPVPGFRIEGKLLGPITESELQKLDAYEESFYVRIAVSVTTHEGIREALTYIDGRSQLPFTLQNWDPEKFEKHHLETFIQKLKTCWEANER